MGAGFRFFNTNDFAVDLVIEPWADVEPVPAYGRVDFHVEGEHTEFEFSWNAGGPLVFVWGDEVTMTSTTRRMVWRNADPYRGKPPFMRWHGDPPDWGELPDPSENRK
jgi:hypothetical protein